MVEVRNLLNVEYMRKEKRLVGGPWGEHPSHQEKGPQELHPGAQREPWEAPLVARITMFSATVSV